MDKEHSPDDGDNPQDPQHAGIHVGIDSEPHDPGPSNDFRQPVEDIEGSRGFQFQSSTSLSASSGSCEQSAFGYYNPPTEAFEQLRLQNEHPIHISTNDRTPLPSNSQMEPFGALADLPRTPYVIVTSSEGLFNPAPITPSAPFGDTIATTTTISFSFDFFGEPITTISTISATFSFNLRDSTSTIYTQAKLKQSPILSHRTATTPSAFLSLPVNPMLTRKEQGLYCQTVFDQTGYMQSPLPKRKQTLEPTRYFDNSNRFSWDPTIQRPELAGFDVLGANNALSRLNLSNHTCCNIPRTDVFGNLTTFAEEARQNHRLFPPGPSYELFAHADDDEIFCGGDCIVESIKPSSILEQQFFGVKMAEGKGTCRNSGRNKCKECNSEIIYHWDRPKGDIETCTSCLNRTPLIANERPDPPLETQSQHAPSHFAQIHQQFGATILPGVNPLMIPIFAPQQVAVEVPQSHANEFEQVCHTTVQTFPEFPIFSWRSTTYTYTRWCNVSEPISPEPLQYVYGAPPPSAFFQEPGRAPLPHQVMPPPPLSPIIPVSIVPVSLPPTALAPLPPIPLSGPGQCFWIPPGHEPMMPQIPQPVTYLASQFGAQPQMLPPVSGNVWLPMEMDSRQRGFHPAGPAGPAGGPMFQSQMVTQSTPQCYPYPIRQEQVPPNTPDQMTYPQTPGQCPYVPAFTHSNQNYQTNYDPNSQIDQSNSTGVNRGGGYYRGGYCGRRYTPTRYPVRNLYYRGDNGSVMAQSAQETNGSRNGFNNRNHRINAERPSMGTYRRYDDDDSMDPCYDYESNGRNGGANLRLAYYSRRRSFWRGVRRYPNEYDSFRRPAGRGRDHGQPDEAQYPCLRRLDMVTGSELSEPTEPPSRDVETQPEPPPTVTVTLDDVITVEISSIPDPGNAELERIEKITTEVIETVASTSLDNEDLPESSDDLDVDDDDDDTIKNSDDDDTITNMSDDLNYEHGETASSKDENV